MLRCYKCGGHAHPALAHLHGLMQPLCWGCTQRFLALREMVNKTPREWLVPLIKENADLLRAVEAVKVEQVQRRSPRICKAA